MCSNLYMLCFVPVQFPLNAYAVSVGVISLVAVLVIFPVQFFVVSGGGGSGGGDGSSGSFGGNIGGGAVFIMTLYMVVIWWS